jgi:hypothetical protein
MGNRLFSSPGGAARVGSIPIARSTPRIGQETWGHEIRIKTLIQCETSGTCG